jgi:hypothetical protein
MFSFTNEQILRMALYSKQQGWLGYIYARMIKKFILIVIALLFIDPCLAAAKHHKIHKHTHTQQKSKKTKHPAYKNVKTPIRKKSTTQSRKRIRHEHVPVKTLTKNQNHVTPNVRQPQYVSLRTKTSNKYNDFAASMDKRLVEFINKMVATLRYSAYKLGGTHFDTSRGVYIIDCSNYVDRLLKETYPRAYSKLVNWSRSAKPTTHDYYHFFTKLSDDPQRYWNPVEDVKQLRAGDILVFRKKTNMGSGHIVVVMDKPIRNKNMFILRIADSAPFRHSQDTRLPNVSGIGIGTMLLKVNPKTYQPSEYAWSLGSSWKKNFVFAMARPMDIRS